MKKDKRTDKKWRVLQGVSVLAVLLLVTVSIPNVEASASGINEHGKYYWNRSITTTVQVHRTDSAWSVPYSNNVVDGVYPHHSWGELRMWTRPLYANPSGVGFDRGQIGSVRLFAQIDTPRQITGGTSHRVLNVRLLFFVYSPNGYEFPYGLGGFTTEYSTRVNHEILQSVAGGSWDTELGGVNVGAQDQCDAMLDFMETTMKYAISHIGGNHIVFVIDALQFFHRHTPERPSWQVSETWRAGRPQVMYAEDDGSYDGRYMIFWDKVRIRLPLVDEHQVENTFLNVRVDGLAQGFFSHQVDYSHTSWTIHFKPTDNLEDQPGGGGGWTPGPGDPIMLGNGS